MGATATLTQIRTNEPNGYKIVNTITNPVDIPSELFVYSSNDSTFSHVATLYDFAYPNVQTVGYAFYRQDNATKEYADVVSALDFANHVKMRVDVLLTAYSDTDMTEFLGTFNFPLPEVP